MKRIMVKLTEDETKAMWHLAEQERRDPRQQAALCIRRELERRGLLSKEAQAETTAQAVEQ